MFEIVKSAIESTGCLEFINVKSIRYIYTSQLDI
jgi:hypothetical protein